MKKFAMGSLVLLLAMSFVLAPSKEDETVHRSGHARDASSAGRWMEPPWLMP